MAHLEEHTTIDSLLSLNITGLKDISNQDQVMKKENGNLLVSFDITYNGKEGYITINYNPHISSYGDINLDIDFARPAGAYNYPKLYNLATKFMQFAVI